MVNSDLPKWHALFHKLWSRDVGRDGYEKNDWKELEKQIFRSTDAPRKELASAKRKLDKIHSSLGALCNELHVSLGQGGPSEVQLTTELRYSEARGQHDLFVIVDAVPRHMLNMVLPRRPWEIRLGEEERIPEVMKPTVVHGGLLPIATDLGLDEESDPWDADALRLQVGIVVITRNVDSIDMDEVVQQLEKFLSTEGNKR